MNGRFQDTRASVRIKVGNVPGKGVWRLRIRAGFSGYTRTRLTLHERLFLRYLNMSESVLLFKSDMDVFGENLND